MKHLFAILLGGGLFGYGLALSGMARPEVVLSFLQLRDLGLLLVMAAALVVTTIGFRLAPRLRETTLLGLPFSHEVKPMLAGTVPGAVIFGVGWGSVRPVPWGGGGQPRHRQRAGADRPGRDVRGRLPAGRAGGRPPQAAG